MNLPLLYQWTATLGEALQELNSWQVENVALFTLGVIQAESCQQAQVARQAVCQERVESTTRRWRRFLDNAAFPLVAFFAEWTSWVIRALGSKSITLLVDETKLHDRIGVMVVGVAWQERCIPLAWRAYAANKADAYPAEGQVQMIATLLKQVQAGVPDTVKVLVLADRGIGCSPDLCREVEALGWKYLFRVTCQTKIVTETGAYTIAQQVQPGEIWAASGTVFKQRGRIPAHARALWGRGYDEPWALVTNDERLTGHEYARRNWQEQSFRDLKSGGWQWGDSRVRLPDHVNQLLVILVIAYAWIIAIGSHAVEADQAHPLHSRPDGQKRRHWSAFKDGLHYFVEYVQRYTICLDLRFIPDKRFT
jgi:hypothetical protein